jgi:hypothetical protein
MASFSVHNKARVAYLPPRPVTACNVLFDTHPPPHLHLGQFQKGLVQ